jgi:nucleotide-binding universal stress UspA family protein
MRAWVENRFSEACPSTRWYHGDILIRIERILVPTDFSESAHKALVYGISFAKEFSAELILLHVVEPVAIGYGSDLFPVPMAEVFKEMSGYARAEIAKLAAEAREKGVEARELVVQGKPSSEVLRVAEQETVSLIVLGTHGKGMLDHAIFGSTTERVVRRAPCPVLTCRPEEHEFVDGV